MADFPHPFYSKTVLQPAYFDAQKHLFGAMLDAHDAHAVMLAECDIITEDNARALIDAIATIRTKGAEAFDYVPGVEDLFFRIEAQIIELAGPDYGGNLQLARSRNDLGQALARMALRDMVLDLYSDLLMLRQGVATLAAAHLKTFMPGYTHTQPAQPVTFAHYLVGVLSFLEKDQARLAHAYQNVNESPLGAAAFTGSGFPIDRDRVAQLLGFGGVIASTHHSIGAGDHLTDISFAIQSLAIGLSRVTKDLLFLATRESNALYIDDSFIQISSIMPQKRNPVVLEHLRARLSRTVGYAQTIATQCHNIPYGDTQDIEDEILPPVAQAISTARECLQLYAAFFTTLKLNEQHLRAQSSEEFTTATELADELVRREGLSFRQAHKIVATAVQTALKDPSENSSTGNITLSILQTAARETLGQELPVDEAFLRDALDPERFVSLRTGMGGVSPDATGNLLEQLTITIQKDHLWLDDAKNALADADNLRRQIVASFWPTASIKNPG